MRRNPEAQYVGEFGVDRDLFGSRFGGVLSVPLELLSTCNGFDATPYHSHCLLTNFGYLIKTN